jgi:hypothetical protein
MSALHELKKEIHRQCVLLTEERIGVLQREIGELREAAGEQGKSSAGDKHETGRAMTDLEIEKNQVSLKNLLQIQAALKQFDPLKKQERPTAGALVGTDQGLFYIAASLGRIQAGEKEIMVISPDAPIVKALQLYPIKNPVVFNNRIYQVKEII